VCLSIEVSWLCSWA